MGRNWRYVLWVYVAGAVATLALLIQNAYGNGGFERHHNGADIVIIAATYLAAAALWPLMIVWIILIYFGLVSDTITF
jgi:hypothetical protein